MKTNVARMILLTVVVLALSSFAAADTIYTSVLSNANNCGGNGAPCNGYTFTTTVDQTSAGNFLVSFQVQNTNNGAAAYLQGFGLTLFTGSAAGTFINSTPALPTGFSVLVFDNSKLNNGNDNCGTVNDHPGSLCIQVDSANGGYLIPGPGGAGVTFTLGVTTATTTTVQPSWHIMTTGTECQSGSGCGNVFALTNDSGFTTTTSTVPEPASLALLGSGMLGLGGFIRRRISALGR